MIKINRGPPPEFFQSDMFQEMLDEVWAFFTEEYGVSKIQSSYDFPMLKYLKNEIEDQMLERFKGKCSFCESPIEASSSVDLENFRPRRGARGLSESDPQAEKSSLYYDTHYWWLALHWENLLLICPQCNRAKSSWFPLADESARAQNPVSPEESWAVVENEEPLLIDPCGELDPAEHIRFGEDGHAIPLSDKGKVTISILNLNRSDLVSARYQALDEFRTTMDRLGGSTAALAYQTVEDLVRANFLGEDLAARPYLAIQNQYLHDMYSEMQAHEQAPGVDEEEQQPEEPAAAEPELSKIDSLDLSRLTIQNIKLHNFKNIADIDIEVPSPTGTQAPWLVFLGENAVGKSTIMQAIILTLMGDQHRSELPDLQPIEFLRYYLEDGRLKHSEEGFVEISVAESNTPLRLSFTLDDPEFHSNVPAPRAYLMAYGPTRLLPDPDQAPYESGGMVRVRNLFRPSTPLVDAREWLFKLHETDPESFHIMVRALRELLLMKENETIEPDLEHPDERRILVHFKNEITDITKLSDGYRSIVALAVDMMSMLSREGTSMESAEGIVLIDELGTNLHPGWKKRIVSSIRDAFPLIQFIGTTHEPLCLRGLKHGETVLLRRDFDNNIVPITNLPNPDDLRIDELLTSEFFGLSSTLETDLEDLYEEYYRLLNLETLDETQKHRKAELKEKLRERSHLGTGLRDELMYEVIDKLLADHLKSPAPMDRRRLKKETLQRVLDSWKAAGLVGGDS